MVKECRSGYVNVMKRKSNPIGKRVRHSIVLDKSQGNCALGNASGRAIEEVQGGRSGKVSREVYEN